MALSDKSIFVYGIQVTPFNSSLDFKASVLDATPRPATLKVGFYSVDGLAREITRALQEYDALHTYTVTVNRNVGGGLQNRLTISSSGSFFQLLFASGPRAISSCSGLIGFNSIDYLGVTFYTGSSSVGTVLAPTLIGYNFLSPDFMHKVFGSVNLSAYGSKEAIVYSVQKFFQVEFRYEPKAKVELQWKPFLDWAIQQRSFEFTPEVSNPTVYYECTLEKSSDDGKGLGYKMDEMLPQFANFYKTGLLTFRQRNP